MRVAYGLHALPVLPPRVEAERLERGAQRGVERAIGGIGHGEREVEQIKEQRTHRHGCVHLGAELAQFTRRIKATARGLHLVHPREGVIELAVRLLGGADDLQKLIGSGELDKMLAAPRAS